MLPNNQKNIVYGTINANGNVHIGDIIYYIERDFQLGNILFLRLEKAKRGIVGYQPKVTVSTLKLEVAIETCLQNNGTGIPGAATTFEFPLPFNTHNLWL